MNNQPNNPLHGLTLEAILTKLVEHYGWQQLSLRIKINCFKKDPSVKSSLKFLRKTPWAREKVEQLYINTFSKPRVNPWDGL
ncbi:VF530 family protein [Thalassotalea agarivorans]|uniref:Uncharacterized conserved protein n=1 Tax=Thalassotalea agarivorans TaxID=349064 RepID=A0A1I0GZP8_THASX|nr:VF530 family protein [Thalassotalea agarivorans]SET76906.1 Uncharacterized conserved protein [Thalassotalea agarivorans]